MTEIQKRLSSGLEDYIEAIYVSSMNGGELKSADLARILKISRASVSEALTKLTAKGLIKYNRYENITLTPQGEKEAKEVYAKHHILKDFFEFVLEISPKEAGENACKIEHIVSKNILNKMSGLTEFYKLHKKFLKAYVRECKSIMKK